MPKLKPKRLLVEGRDDQFVIINLMKHHVDWPDGMEEWPVYVEDTGGVDALFRVDYLKTKLKESGLQTLGIVIDADAEPAARWQRIQQIFRPAFPALPNDMPADGLVIDNQDGLRLGVWLMPDCASPGMLETFLKYLMPDEPTAQALWKHAQAAFAEARRQGCPCRDAHDHKAQIHTWLAWQDPPGEPLGLAVARKMLDPKAPYAASFVAWFIRLYGLEPRAPFGT